MVINAVEVSSSCSRGRGGGGKTVVLAHGLGSGCGFFFSNIDPLLIDKGGGYDRVIAVDWLGFGGSSRPNCRSHTCMHTHMHTYIHIHINIL